MYFTSLLDVLIFGNIAATILSREEFIYSTQIRARAPDSDKTMCIGN